MPKTKRNKKQYGGEFLGEGGFGSVYGNPRLKCMDDTETDDIQNTVSKIFKKDEDEDEEEEKEHVHEFNVLNRLQQHMEGNDLTLLKEKYSILPIKTCTIDDSSLGTDPYNTEPWKTRTQGKNVIRSEHFFKDSNSTAETGTSLVIYEKGGENLSTTFEKLKKAKNINEFYQVLTKLTNILEAIQILQRNNFIHGDIKLSNCIVDKDDNYRLIDMADVEWIPSESFYGNGMPDSFMYFTWPPTAVYSNMFSKNMTSIDLETFTDLFDIDEKFNKVSFETIDYYFSVFDDFKDNYTIRVSNENIFEIKKKLVSQKMFGIKDKDVYSQQSQSSITKQLSKFNKFFAGNAREQIKIDLFKRCDIYSFGMMVLMCIKRATGIIKGSFIGKTETLLQKLFEFVQMCCYQQSSVMNIDTLVSFWKTHIIKPITTKPFVKKTNLNKDLKSEDSSKDPKKDLKPEDSSKDPKKDLKPEDSSMIRIPDIKSNEDSPSPKGCIGKACKFVSRLFTQRRRRRGGSNTRRRRNKTRRRKSPIL